MIFKLSEAVTVTAIAVEWQAALDLVLKGDMCIHQNSMADFGRTVTYIADLLIGLGHRVVCINGLFGTGA